MVSKEFFKQIEEYAQEKDLDIEQVLDSFAISIKKATQKETGKTARVEFDPNKNEIKVSTQRLTKMENNFNTSQISQYELLQKSGTSESNAEEKEDEGENNNDD